MRYSLVGIFSYSIENEDMQSCRLCHEDVSDGIYLSGGGLVHYECVRSLEDEASNFANELSMICDRLKINVFELINLANKHP